MHCDNAQRCHCLGVPTLFSRHHPTAAVVDNSGRTAFSAALLGEQIECAAALQLYGVDVNHIAHDGKAPLHDAVLFKQPTVVMLLLEYGARAVLDTHWYLLEA
jgi:ankyrin repeat protein